MNANELNPTSLLTCNEVAGLLRVSRAFAYNLVKTGQIPALRMGRTVRVRYGDLLRYMEHNVRSQPDPFHR